MTKIQDAHATAQALLKATESNDGEGFMLLWVKLSDEERLSVAMVLSYLLVRPLGPR